MPVNQRAADNYEREASQSSNEYAANASTAAWREGVQQGNIEQGLAQAGVSNVEGSGLQQAWEQGVNDAEFRVDESAYQQGVSDAGDEWLQSMSDASQWNL